MKLYQSTAPLFSGANDTLIASKVMTLGGGTPNWQRFDFDAPVWVQANTVLCIYWHQAPGDNSYGYTDSYFSAGVTTGNLYAYSHTEGDALTGFGGNGVWEFNQAATVVPRTGESGRNFWVDSIFDVDTGVSLVEQRLLLNLDGTDGSTSIVDSSSYVHACAAVGDAQIDTAQFKFGGAALLLDGNDAVEMPNSHLWKLPDDFVFDWWVRLSSLPSVAGSCWNFGNAGEIGGGYPNGSRSQDVGIWSDGKLYFFDRPSSQHFVKGATAMTTGVWYHIAIVCSSDVIRIFLDGVQQASGDGFYTDGDIDATAIRDRFNGIGWRIGARYGDDTHGVVGWIDEYRVRIGTDGGWFDGFTPPSAAYSAGAPRSQAAIIG